jgi:hypothetical protein
VPKVGGIPITPIAAAFFAVGRESTVSCTRGAAMTRILSELLLFSCMTALVTGIVLAAARLLI